MTYDPGSIVTYDGKRLVPAPQVSFNTELVYGNDTIAGYSYVVNLSGYATAIDYSSSAENKYGLTDVSGAVQKIRDAFSTNGENLLVKDKDNNTIMECRGGTVRSIVFEESGNNWVNYAPYKIEIEFSEILINGCNISNNINCTSLTVDSDGTAPNLIDLTKYKIRSFNDSWSFNISDTAYNNYDIFQNQYIDIEYTVSATGKNFYTPDKQLLPAWEQAKNFVQDRVYHQVKGLIGSILNRSNGGGCSPSKTLSGLHALGSPGGIDGISSSTHKIYNETISCETSEAEGSFSATYKAILKYNGTDPLVVDCIHTFNKSKNLQQDAKSKNVSISVQGSITGLIPGGLINTPNIIEFPSSGQIFITSENDVTKHSKALSAFANVKNSTGDDLSDTMKTKLQITGQELLVDCAGSSPKVSSFSTTHDYTSGVISYSAEYNSNRAAGHDGSYRNISITVDDAVPIVAEFIIPGRANGPIIQKIGPSSPVKVSINIEGVSTSLICCPDVQAQVNNICSGSVSLPPDIPVAEIPMMKLTSNQETINTLDGSYVISRSYIKYNS